MWERIQASMNFEEGDRVPIWDYLDNRSVVNHFARDEDDYSATMVRAYHNLGIDLYRGYGSSFAQEQEGEQSDSGAVKSKISGRTSWKVRYEIESIEALKAYNPEFVSFE